MTGKVGHSASVWHVTTRLVLLTLVAMIPPVVKAEAVAWDLDAQRWRTLSSEHFELHFPSELAAEAERTLVVSEQVYDELTAWFRFKPEHKTRVVLVDDYDSANGWATPLPFAQMRLFANPPDQVTGLEHNKDWLSLLIRHEFTHVLHMEAQRGVVQASRNIFGRVAFNFPHAAAPSLYLEGLAVYLESRGHPDEGRLNSSYYRMLWRQEASQGFLPLDEVVIPALDWPFNRTYLYGGWFFQYLAERFGDDGIRRWVWIHSGRLFPYSGVESDFRRAFGVSLPTLWHDFLVTEQLKYQRWQDRQSGNTNADPEQRLTPDGPQPRRQLATDGRRLFMASANGQDKPVVEVQDPATNKFKWLADTRLIRSLAILSHDDENAVDDNIGKTPLLAWTRTANRVDGRAWSDVFIWQDGKEHRTTHASRIRQVVHWRAGDGEELMEHLLGRRIVAGRSELLALRIPPEGDAELRILWQGNPGVVLGQLAVSPDGQNIVAMMKSSAGMSSGWDLYRFDMADRQWQQLTSSTATENSPYVRDNGRVLFSADYDGVFNIWQLDPDGNSLQKLTDVQSGAFDPLLVNDQLVYQVYGADGFEVIRQPLRVIDHIGAAAGETQTLTDAGNTTEDTITTVEDSVAYQPWSSMLPYAWFPGWYVDEYQSSLGVQTWGQDALGRHSWQLYAQLDVKNQLPGGWLAYQYDNRFSMLWQLGYEYADTLDSDGNVSAEAEELWIGRRNNLWIALEDRLALNLGISRERHWQASGEGRGAGSYQTGQFGMAAVYSDLRQLREVPETAAGLYADLVWQSHDFLPSDFDGDKWQSRISWTLDLPGKHTATLASDVGLADLDAEYFLLGGLTGDESLLFNRTDIALPGYAAAVRYGHAYSKQSISSRIWLTKVRRNLGLWPLGAGDLYSRVYFNGASVWRNQTASRWLPSLGAEASLQLWWGFRAQGRLTLGLARGLDDDDGEWQGYITLGWPLGN